MHASPDDIQNITTGTITLLGELSVLPTLAIAPILLIFKGLTGLLSSDEDEDQKGKE